MKYRIGILVVGLLAAATSMAQMGMGGGGRGGGNNGGMGMGQRPVFPQVNRETLIMTRLDDWVSAPATATANKTDVFLFPTGEDSSNWTEALQQEAYNTTAGMESAQQVYELRSAGDQENCPNYESEVREDEPDNGYSTIVWRQSCQPSPEATFASLHKVVLGNDRLYILSKIWKEEPSGRIWRRWENIFEDIYVCDPTRAEHTCRPIPPDPGNATGGGGRNAL